MSVDGWAEPAPGMSVSGSGGSHPRCGRVSVRVRRRSQQPSRVRNGRVHRASRAVPLSDQTEPPVEHESRQRTECERDHQARRGQQRDERRHRRRVNQQTAERVRLGVHRASHRGVARSSVHICTQGLHPLKDNLKNTSVTGVTETLFSIVFGTTLS